MADPFAKPIKMELGSPTPPTKKPHPSGLFAKANLLFSRL
jgi:hypothetical protein